MKPISDFALSLILILSIFSCKKQNEVPAPVINNYYTLVSEGDTIKEVSTTETGSVSGNIAFFTEHGEAISANQQAVISLAGTSFSTSPDAQGRYIFNKVPEGTYDLFYSCPGMGSVNLLNFNVETKNNYVPSVGLIALPAWQLSSVLYFKPYPNDFEIAFHAAGSDPKFKAVRHYLSDHADIDPYDPGTYKLVLSGSTSSDPLFGNTAYKLDRLSNVGFTSNQQIFFRSYPISAWFNIAKGPDFHHISFTDTLSGQLVNTNLNLQGVASFSFICP